MIFFICIIIDQISKYLVHLNNPKLKMIPDFFEITYIKNTGGVFGIGQGTNFLLIIISTIIIMFILYFVKKNINKKTIKYNLWQLVLAGGVGNLVDRIFRGFVVDFIMLKPFGIFNMADMYITIGVFTLLMLEIFELNRKGKNDN